MSAFNILLYSSLIICVAGLVYRLCNWFKRKIGIFGRDAGTFPRVINALSGLFRTLFSLRSLLFIRALFLDVLLQRRILRAGFIRWLAHMLIFWGFMFLLLMHALDAIITQALFPDYYSTLNPFLFLRSLFGVMVLAGIFIAVGRRLLSKHQRIRATKMDKYAVFIVAFIILSGIFLEGAKMTSYSKFENMVDDYAGIADDEEIKALESFWVKNYGLISPAVTTPVDADVLSQGEEANETYCASCHVSNKWGFSGYTSAKMLSPFALWLDGLGGVSLFWYVHIIACFLGLALLPFTKMFHIISVPVSSIVNAVRGGDGLDPVNLTTIQAIEIDACTHCGVCSQSCSAAMMYEVLGNTYILPSEKMQALKRLIAKKRLNQKEMQAVRQGVYVCTNCDRCTVVCPSGIRLKDLWVNVREDLLQRGGPEKNILSPFSYVRGVQRKIITKSYDAPIEDAVKAVSGRFEHLMKEDLSLSFVSGKHIKESKQLMGTTDYTYCFECRNCTVICPVVASYDNPGETLGLLPHQIMCALGLNLVEMASGAPMIWYCLTCYQCQEHCPQNVPVCDLLYRLKNVSAKRIEEV